MDKSNFFQMVVLVVLGFAIVIAVLIFSGVLPGFGGGGKEAGGEVVIWGVFTERSMNSFIDDFNRAHNKEFSVKYVYHSPDQIENDYLQARARGGAPDILLAPDTLINRYRDTFYTTPFSAFSLRNFRDTFVEGAEILLSAEGVVALPLSVDPLVMYYNKDMLSRSGVVSPAQTWSDILVQVSKVNSISQNNTINQSLVAMGDFNNIRNAKSIFESLLFQAGNPIVQMGTGGRLSVTFGDNLGFNQNPAVATADFFSQFAVSDKNIYSWNASLPEDRKVFTAGKLATYFGLGSELNEIRNLNPNLNFDVAILPQRETGDKKVTKAVFYGLGLVNNSKNLATASKVAWLLVDKTNNETLAGRLSLPPARRDLLASGVADPFLVVLYQSAVIGRSWFDPSPSETKRIFASLIRKIVSRQVDTSFGVLSAHTEITNLLP